MGKNGTNTAQVTLDEWIIMPNHVHLMIIVDGDGRGTARRAPTGEQFGKPTIGTIPTIIRSFKSAVTKRINALRGLPGMPVWQRNYYEHIIRNNKELNQIREYSKQSLNGILTGKPTKNRN